MIINNITFNFLDKYYTFYEWLAEDELITEKCYVYKVSSNVLTDLIEYNIILDKSFLRDIPLVFCDDYTAIGVQFNSNGESTYKSSLLLTDEEKILNYTKFMKKGNINYKKKNIQINREVLRNEENIKNKLMYEVDKLIKNNDIEKFKFIYYEWFNKDENCLYMSEIRDVSKLPAGVLKSKTTHTIVRDSGGYPEKVLIEETGKAPREVDYEEYIDPTNMFKFV